MKKIFFILLLVCLTVFKSTVYASENSINSNYKYAVRIKLLDLEGNVVNMENTKYRFNIKDISISNRYGYGDLKSLSVNITSDYIEILTKIKGDIGIILSEDNENYLYHVIEKISEFELVEDKVIEKIYSLKDLTKITLKTNIGGESGGEYKFVIQPINFGIEGRTKENIDGFGQMNKIGEKIVYTTKGEYKTYFIYTKSNKHMIYNMNERFFKKDQLVECYPEEADFDRYTTTISPILKDYKYYNFCCWIGNDSQTFEIWDSFHSQQNVEYYIYHGMPNASIRMYISKYYGDIYKNSLGFYLDNYLTDIGSSYYVNSININKNLENTYSVQVKFNDENGNSLWFIDIPKCDDMIIEVMDLKKNHSICKKEFSKYWGEFDYQLPEGTYIARVYPKTKELGFDYCSYFKLNVTLNKNVDETLYLYEFTYEKSIDLNERISVSDTINRFLDLSKSLCRKDLIKDKY